MSSPLFLEKGNYENVISRISRVRGGVTKTSSPPLLVQGDYEMSCPPFLVRGDYETVVSRISGGWG